LQNTGPILAKWSHENKSGPGEGDDVAMKIGAGEGNRTLDTQLGNPKKAEDNQE
jgi:hypothetical protein